MCDCKSLVIYLKLSCVFTCRPAAFLVIRCSQPKVQIIQRCCKLLLVCFYLYDYLFHVKHESMFISRRLLFPQKPSLLREPCDAVMAVALLGDISNSYVQAIFKVKVRSQEDYSEKIALSRISKRWESALKNADYHAYRQDWKRVSQIMISSRKSSLSR